MRIFSRCIWSLALAVLCGCTTPVAEPVQQVPFSANVSEPLQLPPRKTVKETVPDKKKTTAEKTQPEFVLHPSEPIWLLGRLTDVHVTDETEWVAVDSVLEAIKPLQISGSEILSGFKSVCFQEQNFVQIEDIRREFGLEWGQEPEGLRYLARRQIIGDIPDGYNVPVLMYHAVGDDIWGYSDLFVSTAEMEAQLQYLQENGYETIWFSDLEHIDRFEKPVILTFDDGYDDNYTVLYPLLEKYQSKATIFVIGNAMGKPHKMTREQVYELAVSGLVSIQSHTYTHGNLSAMDEAEIRHEMEMTNATLAATTGQIPYVLCYPEGNYSDLTIDIAKAYYTFALRMNGWTYQTGMDRYQVPRSFVSRRSTISEYSWFVSSSGKAK